MFEFERLENGNVLLRKGSIVVRVFPSQVHMSIDPCADNLIVLNSSNGNKNDADSYTISQDTVSVPASTDRDDLLAKLTRDIFKPVQMSIGSVTIEDTIPAKTVNVFDLSNGISEFLVSSSNTVRTECIIHNDSDTTVYIKYNSGVTSTNYTHKLFKQDTLIVNDFHGDLYALADDSNGFIMVTENILTP